MRLPRVVPGSFPAPLQPQPLLTLTVLAVLLTSSWGPAVSHQAAASRVSNDICEYDIDLRQNTFKAKCQGQPLGVSVYADTARVTATHVVPDQTQTHDRGGPPRGHTAAGGGGGGGRGSSAAASGAGSGGGGGSSDIWRGPAIPLVTERAQNTSAVLEGMMRKLGGQRTALGNISSLLGRGDNDLRSDLEALRSLSADDSAMVRESIIATMRNQYNFMRTAILAHNTELSHVLQQLQGLVTLTGQMLYDTHRAQQSLHQQVAHLNRSVAAVREALAVATKRKNKVVKTKGECPRRIAALGGGEAMAMPWDKGVVMTDAGEGSGKVFLMQVGEQTDQLRQYDTRADIHYKLVSRYYSLPMFCDGTGHVVYRDSFVCQKTGTRTLVKYKLKSMTIAEEMDIPDAGISGTYPYQFGLNSDIDLAVDELGLWVIYSTKDAAGKMVISKLNPKSLTIEKTWLTSYPKQKVGNAWMTCGVLYATNSHQDTPTFVRYTYDTATQQEAVHDPGYLLFNNAVASSSSSSSNITSGSSDSRAGSVMLSYDPRQHKLYSWSHGQIQIYPVYFATAEEP